MNDRIFKLSIGNSRMSKNWRVREFTWQQIVTRLGKFKVTDESFEAYQAMPKEQRDLIKDCGGFVGGALRGRYRRKGAVICRSLITLDLDQAEPDFWDSNFSLFNDCAALVYSTHSHTEEHPRLRLVIPLDRDCTPEEYIAVARKVAEDVGIEQMDRTTYQPERLMYYPSRSRDGAWEFHAQDGPWLSVDEMLARYADWHDVSQYPTAASEEQAVGYEVRSVADPLEKEGIIGAFNRTYSIAEAIDKYLPDVYAPAGEGRYTYTGGSSAGGAVVYRDGTILYSNHATDPAGGHAMNAYDLVRVHLYGDLDTSWDGRPEHRKPSEKAMADLIAADADVSLTITREAAADFDGVAAAGEDDGAEAGAGTAAAGAAEVKDELGNVVRSVDLVRLERDRQGKPKTTIDNYLEVLEHDPALVNIGRMNIFTNRMEVSGRMPWDSRSDGSRKTTWTDNDLAGFKWYCEKKWRIVGQNTCRDALAVYYNRHRYHPVREYLDSLKWDGVPRAETILIDYLGAEDSEYVRTVTRKVLAAAVKRIYEPGCKWDFMLTMTGAQGIGKSTLFRKLGKGWYDDSLTDVRTKDANDLIQGVWIEEMAELTATRYAESEAVKQFISKQFDTYRKAYGVYTETYPRQCIFVGTTNNPDFLADKTGNRRYWVVEVGREDRRLSVFDDLTDDIADQIWAESVLAYRNGEDLFLTPEMERMADEMQLNYSDSSDMRAEISEFLDTMLPPNWYTDMSIEDHRAFMEYRDVAVPRGSEGCTLRRDVVCAKEIAMELFGQREESLYKDGKSMIRDIKRIMSGIPGWKKYAGQKTLPIYGCGRRDAYYRVGSAENRKGGAEENVL